VSGQKEKAATVDNGKNDTMHLPPSFLTFFLGIEEWQRVVVWRWSVVKGWRA
jgi:hypothetical protein